jgi:hypothetical protein
VIIGIYTALPIPTHIGVVQIPSPHAFVAPFSRYVAGLFPTAAIFL